MPQGARRSGRGGGGGRGRNKDTSRRPASGRGATKARRTISGGTGRCESEASVPPRPSEYRKFDSATSNVRGVMIGSLADELIRHKDSKGGRAQRGFVEGLVTRTNGVAPLLKITRDDINDEVKRRKKKKKKEAESARAAVFRLLETLLQTASHRSGAGSDLHPTLRHLGWSHEETHGAQLLVHRRIAPLHLCSDNEQPSHFIRHESGRVSGKTSPMLAESTNEDGEVVIRRTRRHESVDLCEDADGDGSDDEDAAEAPPPPPAITRSE